MTPYFFFCMTNLFSKQTVHDKEHDPLEAAKDGEQISCDYCAPFKLETAEDPHGAQQTQLSHCSDGERPAGGNRDTHRSNLRRFSSLLF